MYFGHRLGIFDVDHEEISECFDKCLKTLEVNYYCVKLLERFHVKL